jgi:homoserine kinase type II
VTIESELCGALRAAWHLAADDCTPSPDSSGREWTVTIRDVTHVIWAVPAMSRLSVQASVAAWDALGAAGIGVGQVIRTATGMRTASVSVAGLNDVEMVVRLDPPGRPLDSADPLDQQWWGDMLGRAHRELQAFRHPAVGRLSWPAAAELTEVVGAVTRLTVTDQLAYGILHTEPSPRLFRIDPKTGRNAIARWGLPVIGPLVYDVALAVHRAG